MKSRILGGLLFLVAVSGVGAAEGWLKSLPAEQFAAAGLTKLTPSELAALEQLVANRAAQVAAAVPTKTPLPATAAKSPPSWFRALITLQETQEKPEAAEAIESRLAGDYSGWSGRTVFRLANGQIWQQISGSQRVDDSRPEPRVKIYPGLLGTYWLEVEGVREPVKVKPLKLK